ncbi:hypothetical protein ACOJBO_32965 [Rhizobium beringeri]
MLPLALPLARSQFFPFVFAIWPPDGWNYAWIESDSDALVPQRGFSAVSRFMPFSLSSSS